MEIEDGAPPEILPDRIEIRRAPDKEPILDASLALSSQGIRHWFEFDGIQFILTVDPEDATYARTVLEDYDSENADFQNEDTPEAPPVNLRLSPLLHLLIPVAVFFWAGSTPWGGWLTQRGGADARRILDGEWWRCLTATSLHVDHEHFLGNMLSGFFILNLLRRRCGPGTSMLLLTLAVGITNFLVAFFSTPNHFSIGFSTVVFAALGLLAGIETLHLPRRSPQLTGLRDFSPLVAAFFLAVLVGIGDKADVKAHFIGFGLGSLCAPLATRLERRAGHPACQIAGVVLVYGIYAIVWMIAQR